MTPTLFIDMDGVLAVHTKSDYSEPTFLYLKDGYFATREIDRRAAEILSNIAIDDTYGQHIYLLSTVNNNIQTAARFYKDKMKWVEKYQPELTGIVEPTDFLTSRLHITSNSKAEKAEWLLGRKLTISDILIDDYNKNLEDWRSHGGTAIKYINNSNDPKSWSGFHITKDLPTEEFIQFLNILLKEQFT